MLLHFSDRSPFSSGACHYLSRRAAPGNHYERPFLSVSVDGHEFDAAVDTGGFFLILDPDLARSMGVEPEQGVDFDGLQLRGVTYRGRLHRVPIKLEAEHGESLEVSVTAFVPFGYYNAPNFLGWPLCLERFRFAFEPSASDPREGWFHFGAID